MCEPMGGSCGGDRYGCWIYDEEEKKRNKRDGRRLFYRKVAMAGDRADGREKYKISHSFLKGEHWI